MLWNKTLFLLALITFVPIDVRAAEEWWQRNKDFGCGVASLGHTRQQALDALVKCNIQGNRADDDILIVVGLDGNIAGTIVINNNIVEEIVEHLGSFSIDKSSEALSVFSGGILLKQQYCPTPLTINAESKSRSNALSITSLIARCGNWSITLRTYDHSSQAAIRNIYVEQALRRQGP